MGARAPFGEVRPHHLHHVQLSTSWLDLVIPLGDPKVRQVAGGPSIRFVENMENIFRRAGFVTFVHRNITVRQLIAAISWPVCQQIKTPRFENSQARRRLEPDSDWTALVIPTAIGFDWIAVGKGVTLFVPCPPPPCPQGAKRQDKASWSSRSEASGRSFVVLKERSVRTKSWSASHAAFELKERMPTVILYDRWYQSSLA